MISRSLSGENPLMTDGKDVGILDEVADGGFGRDCFRFAGGGGLGGEQALVGAGLDLAFQGAGAPVLLLRVRDVILSG